MKYHFGKRILAMALTLCLIVSLIPIYFTVEAEAVSGLNSLTCSSFISNSIARKYIDTMMKYYINNNSNLQTTLNNGLSVVFMFEGGSDNYWDGSAYQDVLYSTRNQAVVIVVQLDSSGNVYIPFYSENCSSVPDDPDWCTYNVGNYQSTTLMDGIYSFYTWNHTGPYAAFQISASTGYYTPSSYPNGQVLGASGINIHTRNLNNCGGKSVNWCRSAGCQLIGSGYDTSNVFNQFMKVVGGITWNSWISYSSGTYNTWATTGTHKGYYVLDRQLGKMGTDGSQFGSGSLINLYNSTALNNITAKSTTARNNAGFSLDYIDQCTRYASHCTLKVTYEGAELRTLPCSEGTADSGLIETCTVGDTLTAVGLYKNTYGNYWYQVLTSTGDLGYIYGGNAAYQGDILTDITLTGATYPNGHVYNTAFYVNGTIASKYNELTQVACYVYEGFGITNTHAIGASDTPSSNTYELLYSTVDDNTWMARITEGNYTYCLFASYINYYATDATTLQSNSGTLTLAEEYFAVISTSVDQSTCAHSNTTHVLAEGSCTSERHTVTVCSTCGLMNESVTAGAHSYGQWITEKEPTCTDAGTLARTCAACGAVETQDITATGHDYDCVTLPATCLEYERLTYTCRTCGDQYSENANEQLGDHSWAEGVCSTCGAACQHSYQNRLCTICGMEEPIRYYLFGFINGANYACETDYANLGEYGFTGDTLTVKFTQDSYVGIKTGDNNTWYMTDGWLGTNVTSATLYDTTTIDTTVEKLYVPGGVEVTFTLIDNGDGTLTLSYEADVPEVTVPTISLKYPTLSFEDEILMNVYFAATELDNVAQMGLITYSSNVSSWNIGNAEAVIPGYTWSESAGFYYTTTEGIAAKCLGDTIYFAVYAELSDGSYFYTNLVSYSPKSYAYNQLRTGKEEQRPLVVAMLNYGAAAQTYFGYKTTALVNADLTDAQKALVESYSATMMNGIVAVDSSKVGFFTNTNGFSRKYPTISFEGAFSINYYFTPSGTPTGKVVMYYWNQSAYNAATTLTAANATGLIIMTQTDSGEYQATVEGIAAKDLDSTIYVAAGYAIDGGSLCSGVIGYSIGSYCVSQAAKATALQPFAAATAVYGYYAKQYFYDVLT